MGDNIVEIKKATLNDVKMIGDLYQELFEKMAEYEPKYIQSARQDSDFLIDTINSTVGDVLIAQKGAEILGFILIKEEYTPIYTSTIYKHLCRVFDLVVIEKARGLGIGTALLNATETWAKARNLEYIELCVLNKNIKADKLYEKLGYRDFSKTKRKEIK